MRALRSALALPRLALAALLLCSPLLSGCGTSETHAPQAAEDAGFSEAPPPPPPLTLPAEGFSFESTKRPDTCGAAGDSSCAAPAESAKSAAAIAEPDRSCQVDADCAVKNIGNCCGYYPACVNAQAETFPERVKAACEAQGISSVCGFEDISACACIEGQCTSAPGGAALQ